MPAFTKHWAVRVRWTTGEDKVWQIFQADKEVLSPVVSDFAWVRRHFTASYKVCQTHNGAHEVSDAGMPVVRDPPATYMLENDRLEALTQL